MADYLLWRFYKEIKSITKTLFMGYLFCKVFLIQSLPLIFLYFINVAAQLNSQNLPIKLCMCLPKFDSQYSLKMSVFYIPVHFGGAISDFRCLIRFRISLLLKRNEITNASISSMRLFLFLFSTNWLPQTWHRAMSIILKKSGNRNLT